MAGLFQKLGRALFGESEKQASLPNLTPEQQQMFAQLLQAGQGQGAPGVFGQAADYYRGLLDPSSEAMDQFAAPEMRRFQEEIIPGLAERFAGMGSGGALSSSMFRNAAIREGSSLSERLAAMRAGLQGQGAQGIQGIGQAGLQQVQSPYIRQATPGLLGGLMEGVAPGIGKGLGAAMGGPGSYLSSLFAKGTQGI